MSRCKSDVAMLKKEFGISPMFGCLSNLQILASLSSFWWSMKQSDITSQVWTNPMLTSPNPATLQV